MSNQQPTQSKPTGKRRGPKARVKIGQYDQVHCPECHAPKKKGCVRVVKSVPEQNPFESDPNKWRMNQSRKCMKCGHTWTTWYEFERLTR